MVDKYMLDVLAKAINNKSKDITNEEKNRAIAAEDEIRLNIAIIKSMLDDKSIKYVTQMEYDELTDYEKNDENIIYYIIDSEFVNVTRAMVNYWDNKANIDDIKNITDMLNGYSLFIGNSEEISNIVEKDPSTLYLEIGSNIAEIEVVDGVLTMVNNKYQKCNNLKGDVNIVFPILENFTELHLYFDANHDIIMHLPNCKYKNLPNIQQGNTYELIAVYNTVHWLVDIIEYKPYDN